MSSLKKFCLLIFLLQLSILAPSFVFANEHEAAKEEHGGGHESPKEGHEAASEGHEEGGGEHGGGHGEGKSSLSPWVELENKITELSSKIKSKEGNILKMLEEKEHLKNNSPELKALIKEIVKEHNELRSLAEEYDKNVTMLKYRFPERNAGGKRSYDRVEVKSIDEMESAMGIDGKLNRNLKRMRTQFKSEEKPVAEHEPTKTKAASKEPKKEPSIEEAGSVILQK